MKIAVYGASGYTGKLVVAELVRRDIEMVLVGRDIERLRQAAVLAGAAGAETHRPGTADHARPPPAPRRCRPGGPSDQHLRTSMRSPAAAWGTRTDAGIPTFPPGEP